MSNASIAFSVGIAAISATNSGALGMPTDLGKPGILPAQPEPLPGLPPEFILMPGPTSVMPLASSLIKLPPALIVS